MGNILDMNRCEICSFIMPADITYGGEDNSPPSYLLSQSKLQNLIPKEIYDIMGRYKNLTWGSDNCAVAKIIDNISICFKIEAGNYENPNMPPLYYLVDNLSTNKNGNRTPVSSIDEGKRKAQEFFENYCAEIILNILKGD